ncbi:unnamed protein product [Withania somnifera]
MAEVCFGVVTETDSSPPCESNSRAVKGRRMEFRKYKIIASGTPQETTENGMKRPKLKVISRICDNSVENSSNDDDEEQLRLAETNGGHRQLLFWLQIWDLCILLLYLYNHWLSQSSASLLFVATKCKERLHELVKEELEKKELEKKEGNHEELEHAMDQSFDRMDQEVIEWNKSVTGATCRCELQIPECDAVGSTAIVAVVTPDKIIVANCGDSRAVLCRNGKAIPLSNDQKPDRPDELHRIQEAGGRVIYWDGPRVSGVLAMSRAIGDNYLKPYVICVPEVTITDRTMEDDCLILASDGLWDVVSNDTACGVAGMCLKGNAPASIPGNGAGDGMNFDQGCSDASMLLTKLALARRSYDNVSVVVVDLKNYT